MNRKIAGLSFLSISILLALLLLANTITSTVGGIIFTIALVVTGILSNGFRKKTD